MSIYLLVAGIALAGLVVLPWLRVRITHFQLTGSHSGYVITCTYALKVGSNITIYEWSTTRSVSSDSSEPIKVIQRVERERAERVEQGKKQKLPPKFGEYLLYLFLRKHERDPLLGDLEEEYREVYAKFGRRKAQFWYYAQVVRSLAPLSKRAIQSLVKWGIVAWVGDVIRRWTA
jgi:hypothetical protein